MVSKIQWPTIMTASTSSKEWAAKSSTCNSSTTATTNSSTTNNVTRCYVSPTNGSPSWPPWPPWAPSTSKSAGTNAAPDCPGGGLSLSSCTSSPWSSSAGRWSLSAYASTSWHPSCISSTATSDNLDLQLMINHSSWSRGLRWLRPASKRRCSSSCGSASYHRTLLFFAASRSWSRGSAGLWGCRPLLWGGSWVNI